MLLAGTDAERIGTKETRRLSPARFLNPEVCGNCWQIKEALSRPSCRPCAARTKPSPRYLPQSTAPPNFPQLWFAQKHSEDSKHRSAIYAFRCGRLQKKTRMNRCEPLSKGHPGNLVS